MATKSIKSITQICLGISGTISVKQHVLGVYGDDNPQTRSAKERLNLIETMPFVRLALVTIQGVTPLLQTYLDNANLVYQNEANVWIYCVGHTTENVPTLLVLDQDDCLTNGHSVSDDEDDLFDLGRNLGASIVGYFINMSAGTTFVGCAAHPEGRRGFWVGAGAAPWTFAHELTHVVGDNGHNTANNNQDNLMWTPTRTISNLPPDLNNTQRNNINDDAAIESCSYGRSIMAQLPKRIQKAFEADDPCELGLIIKEKHDEDLASIQALLEPDAEVSPEIRGKALYAVGRWGAPAVIPKIVALLPRLDENNRVCAIDALGRLGTKESLDVISHYAKDKSEVVRKFVVKAASRFKETKAKSLLEEIRDTDKSESIRILAQKVIKNYDR